MSEARLPVPTSKGDNRPGIVNNLMERLTDYINDVDEVAAAKRVAALRRRYPDEPAEELAERLIREKCLRAGAVGAVTSGAALLPGLGTFASLTFGVAADIGMTFKLQAELVLEIATLYDRTLTPEEKRRVVLLVTGISAGANQVLTKVGAEVAERATQRLAERAVIKAIPFLGVAASAGANIVSTYVIGRRAQAYFSLGPEAMQSWSDNLRVISGVDERKLSYWLAETTEETWELVRRGAGNAGQAVVVAGKSTGKVIVLGSAAALKGLAGAGSHVWGGIGSVAGVAADFVFDTYQSLRGGPDEAEPAQLEAGTSETAPEAEKPGYLARLWNLFDRDEEPALPDERLTQMAGAEIVGQMVKEGEETVVGVVAVDDDLSEEAEPDAGFLDRLRRFFARFWGGDEAEAQPQSGSALVEHLVDSSDQVSVVIPEEDETEATAKRGPISRIFSFFKRDRPASD